MTTDVHPSAIVDSGATLGDRTRVWHWVHISAGARIGERCSLGQNVFVGNRVAIGDNVRIQNNVSIYDGVTLEDDVFCGPSMVFTNVINPRSHVSRKDEYRPTLVRRGASIGANATIVCGVTIGKYAFVGAGAVVTHDVGDFMIVTGVPARHAGWMCKCGVKLCVAESNEQGHFAFCPACALQYHVTGVDCKLRSPEAIHHQRLRPMIPNTVPKTIEFIDLKKQYARLKPAIDARIQRVLDHGRYIMGPEVTELEERLAAFVGVKHCISVSDGTTALLIALMALGVGKGDEVITTPFSFAATAEVIAILGAKAVYTDVDPATCNIDPALIESAITANSRAIMPVSLYGQCADMDRINRDRGTPRLAGDRGCGAKLRRALSGQALGQPDNHRVH